jgi:outer membrane lipoprotein-sorting protein
VAISISLLVLVVATAASAPADRPPDLFDDLYVRLQPQLASFHTVRARFVETTTSTLLTRPLVAGGVLRASRPSKLRLDYDGPEPRTLIVNERQLVLEGRSRGEHVIRDISQIQKRVQKYFVTKGPEQLRRQFDIRAAVDPKVSGTWQIEMVPKRRQIEEGLTLLQIWIDQRTEFMAKMRMVFAGGDSKVIALEDVQLNPPLDQTIFEAEAR